MSRLIEGVALSLVLAAGPTLIMRTTEGKRQVSAMTFWSTVTPAAVSLSMLLGGRFAGTEQWRTAFVIFAVALVLAGCAGLLLPRLAVQEPGKVSFASRVLSLFEGYRQTDVVKLAIVQFLISMTSLGLNVILPNPPVRASESNWPQNIEALMELLPT